MIIIFLTCICTILTFILGFYFDKIFYILTFILFNAFILILYFSLKDFIFKTVNSNYNFTKDEGKKITDLSADEHPIIIAAKKRLKK